MSDLLLVSSFIEDWAYILFNTPMNSILEVLTESHQWAIHPRHVLVLLPPASLPNAGENTLSNNYKIALRKVETLRQ